MADNFTPLADGQSRHAATFNGPLQQLDDAIEGIKAGGKEMAAPDITSYANAGHDHEDAAGGGKLPVSAFDTDGVEDGAVQVADGAGDADWLVKAPVPPGVCIPIATAAIPSGWLPCTGQAVSRLAFAALFAVIGETFGVGDGISTFNLPDLRGRVVAGLDNMGGTSADRVTDEAADNLGGSMGAESHVLTEAEMPDHTHSIDVTDAGGTGGTAGAGSGTGLASDPVSGIAGSDQAHNNMQPTLFMTWVIRT